MISLYLIILTQSVKADFSRLELARQVEEYGQQIEHYKKQQATTITGITNAITSIGGDVTGTQEDNTWIITS